MKEDSDKAIELNPRYFKAFLRSGEACIELGKLDSATDLLQIDKGIKHLQKALYLCWKLSETDQHYLLKSVLHQEIEKQILQAKKIRWFKHKELETEESELILD